MRRLVSSLAAALVCTGALHAADNPPAPATIRAVSVEAGAGTVIVDGQLNEAVWATATPAGTWLWRASPTAGARSSRFHFRSCDSTPVRRARSDLPSCAASPT